jgi:uncharacterized protein (DUF2062 family)
MRDYLVTLKRTARYLFLRFIRIRRDPSEIARGLAIGVFAGMSPFLGFHIIIAVVLAMLFKGNKIMALIGTGVGNPLTFSFIFYLDYKVGRWVLGGTTESFKPLSLDPLEILHASWKILFPMSLGSLILGLLAATLAYFLSNPLVRFIQERIHKGKPDDFMED